MKIFICAALEKERSIKALSPVIDALAEGGMIPLMLPETEKIYSDERVKYTAGAENECDMFLTVGGDGTILKWGKRSALVHKPLLGVNTGRLGFMTSLDSSCTEQLKTLAGGGYAISSRMMLDISLKSTNDRSENILNDVVLFKESNSKLPEYVVRVNDTLVTKFRADGVIFSTPTGSTAYALSAGGPIIEPSVRCILMTPLCAHTLFSRPMIFSGNDILNVSYNGYEGSKVSLSADGGERRCFECEDVLRIGRSELTCDLVDLGGKSFYATVSDKLMTPLKE